MIFVVGMITIISESNVLKDNFKRLIAVERVNAYLNGYFQLDNVRYRTGKRIKVHFDFVTLVYMLQY